MEYRESGGFLELTENFFLLEWAITCVDGVYDYLLCE